MASGGPPNRWTKPTVGWNKMNIDEAFDADEIEGGADMVFLDEEGGLVFSSC
jgi:hypothetical protein